MSLQDIINECANEALPRSSAKHAYLKSVRRHNTLQWFNYSRRCEKSTAFLKAEGVDKVYHLRGGILKYLETIPADESLWQGECFVFDQRVTVAHGLVPGTHALCHACRRPVSPEQLASALFAPGVSCPACHGERSDEQRAGYRERARQEELAAARGTVHVGSTRAEAD